MCNDSIQFQGKTWKISHCGTVSVLQNTYDIVISDIVALQRLAKKCTKIQQDFNFYPSFYFC